MRESLRNRRGFASVMAVVVLGLVGITIAAMMTRIAMQARRTNEETARAQRQQIEIAKSMGKDIELPAELRLR
jgi:type II secretory pathway component PulK